MATEQELNYLKKREQAIVSDYNKEMEDAFDNFVVPITRTIKTTKSVIKSNKDKIEEIESDIEKDLEKSEGIIKEKVNQAEKIIDTSTKKIEEKITELDKKVKTLQSNLEFNKLNKDITNKTENIKKETSNHFRCYKLLNDIKKVLTQNWNILENKFKIIKSISFDVIKKVTKNSFNIMLKIVKNVTLYPLKKSIELLSYFGSNTFGPIWKGLKLVTGISITPLKWLWNIGIGALNYVWKGIKTIFNISMPIIKAAVNIVGFGITTFGKWFTKLLINTLTNPINFIFGAPIILGLTTILIKPLTKFIVNMFDIGSALGKTAGLLVDTIVSGTTGIINYFIDGIKTNKFLDKAVELTTNTKDIIYNFLTNTLGINFEKIISTIQDSFQWIKQKGMPLIGPISNFLTAAGNIIKEIGNAGIIDYITNLFLTSKNSIISGAGYLLQSAFNTGPMKKESIGNLLKKQEDKLLQQYITYYFISLDKEGLDPKLITEKIKTEIIPTLADIIGVRSQKEFNELMMKSKLESEKIKLGEKDFSFDIEKRSDFVNLLKSIKNRIKDKTLDVSSSTFQTLITSLYQKNNEINESIKQTQVKIDKTPKLYTSDQLNNILLNNKKQLYKLESNQLTSKNLTTKEKFIGNFLDYYAIPLLTIMGQDTSQLSPEGVSVYESTKIEKIFGSFSTNVKENEELLDQLIKNNEFLNTTFSSSFVNNILNARDYYILSPTITKLNSLMFQLKNKLPSNLQSLFIQNEEKIQDLITKDPLSLITLTQDPPKLAAFKDGQVFDPYENALLKLDKQSVDYVKDKIKNIDVDYKEIKKRIQNKIKSIYNVSNPSTMNTETYELYTMKQLSKSLIEA